MSSRTLARRLERIEATLNPAPKPGIAVIVVRAGEPEVEINPPVKPGFTVIVAGVGEKRSACPTSNERENLAERNRLDD